MTEHGNRNMNEVLAAVRRERMRQETLKLEGKFPWTANELSSAVESITDCERLAVLAEEFGEVAKIVTEVECILDHTENRATDVPGPNARNDERKQFEAKLREELVQVAAVAVAWCEAIDLRAHYYQGSLRR